VIMDDLYLGLERLHGLMVMRLLGNVGQPYRVRKMGGVESLKMMVLLKLEGHQSQRKVVVVLEVEVGVGGSDYEALIRMVEATWRLL
jgi:hypothetical protein